jgi:hypothetical protein
MNVRKLILGVAVSVLPLAALTVAGSTVAGASSVGAGTVTCDIGGTVTFSKPLSTGFPQKRDPAKITVNSGSSCLSNGVTIAVTKGTGRFVVSGPDESPCFRYGGGWGSDLTLTLHYSHLKSSVYKGGLQGVQAGGEASSLNGEGNVMGSYPSTVSGPYPSGASFTGLMNDAACFGTGITSTSFSIYMTNF